MIAASGPTLSAVSLALTLVFASLAFIGVIAAAVVVAGSARTKQNLELLRGEVSDLTAAKARIEGEREVLVHELTEMRAEGKILRDIATSRPDVQALITEIQTMVKTIEEGHLKLSAAVEHGIAQSAN
jgi:uncharacterized protein (DUF3084 family)